MIAAGHIVDHYSLGGDTLDQTIHFTDGFRVDIIVRANVSRPCVEALVWQEELPARFDRETGERVSGIEYRKADCGPAKYRIRFDGTRSVADAGQNLRPMTAAENDEWDAKRKARRAQRVKPFSVEKQVAA